MPLIHQFNLTIASEPENIGLLESYVDNIRAFYRFNENVYYNILLVLTEAVNNCIRHGNRCDPSKKVTVKLQEQRSGLIFTIGDEGRGFDPQKLPDPTCQKRRACPDGRGVFLMRKLSDKLKFTKAGKQVEIHFNVLKTPTCAAVTVPIPPNMRR